MAILIHMNNVNTAGIMQWTNNVSPFVLQHGQSDPAMISTITGGRHYHMG
jgi:hypothetical protein